MLVATWNVNSLNARMPRVEEWLAQVEPDIVCLQETKLADDAVPVKTFNQLGYDLAHHGQGQWNGVAILSRVGIDEVIEGFADGIEPDRDARLVSARCGPIRVNSVYVPNGREVGHEQFHYKLGWLERLRLHLEKTADPAQPVVVAGDWNIAPDDRDVWDVKAFEGLTHVTAEERDALENVRQWGLVDTFRERHEDAGLFSYYDYQAGRFHKRQGMRIDYLLATRSLADVCRLDLVDRNARKGSKPSDHAPVLARYDIG
ncbi:MAG: exodeoxyribonuclease III [Acidimicrobiia bacterium]|nr:exodeoxyribonuclease III [Acidimicrobiia bacterium]